jgi:hypothetical protein
MAKAAGKAKKNSGFIAHAAFEHLAKIVVQSRFLAPRSRRRFGRISKTQAPESAEQANPRRRCCSLFSRKKDMFQMTKAVNKHLK